MASKIESGKFIYIEGGIKPNITWEQYPAGNIEYIGAVVAKVRTNTGNILTRPKEKVFTEYEPEYTFSEVDRLLKDHLNYYVGQQRGILEEPVFN